MKKKVMNIRPQEVTENGERSVRYKGSDGKFHDVAPDGGGTAQEPLILECDYLIPQMAILFTDGSNYTIPKIIGMIKIGTKVFLKYGSSVMTCASFDESAEIICFFDYYMSGQTHNQCQQRVITWDSSGLNIRTKVI